MADPTYKNFCDNLEVVLAKHEESYEPDDDLLFRQRAQLRNLIALEADFRDSLIKHHLGRGIYKDFIEYIISTKRNILSARPYFRERQTVFSAHISKALQQRNEKALYRFKFNWMFIQWALSARKWPQNSRIVSLAKKISKQRNDILEQNIPFAISQARIFWNSTPRSHLSYMDIVQVQCQALLLAIDKFSPPDEKGLSEKECLAKYKVFRAVAIGIMARDRVNQYSETLIHFYPPDRLKMYQANKIRRVSGDLSPDDLAAQVTERLKSSEVSTTGPELQSLMAAGSTVSADYIADPDGENILDVYPDEFADNPEEMAKKSQLLSMLESGMSTLTMKEKKILRLKGVKV